MSEKYRPSNGTEGDIFMESFCDVCTASNGELGCDIQTRTMAYGIGDKEYPTEWIYDADGKPTCTSFITS